MQGKRGSWHVLLTSYEFLMAKADRQRLSRVRWRYISVDEGHRLKNAGCKLNAELRHYKAHGRLLLTGMPFLFCSQHWVWLSTRAAASAHLPIVHDACNRHPAAEQPQRALGAAQLPDAADL